MTILSRVFPATSAIAHFERKGYTVERNRSYNPFRSFVDSLRDIRIGNWIPELAKERVEFWSSWDVYYDGIKVASICKDGPLSVPGYYPRTEILDVSVTEAENIASNYCKILKIDKSDAI